MKELTDRDKAAIATIETVWKQPRWTGTVRPYTAESVYRLHGSLKIEHTLARRGAERLWRDLHSEPFLRTFGAITGLMAVQMVKAGLRSIYVSGWQVAADANTAAQTYPDLSLYPADSVPALVRRINNALRRADEILHSQGEHSIDWFVPIIADAEAGFGGNLNASELMKAMIQAGAAAVHFEDQLSSVKKCGHLGGKVLAPIGEFVKKLLDARFAADLMGVPTLLIARTDAESAKFVANDIDERDKPFLTGERTPEGYYVIRGGLDACIARALAYAPYADILWCETSTPNIAQARKFAEEVHKVFPDKLLAYNCSPSFNWSKHLNQSEIASFQDELGKMGYKFQFITLAGFHLLNYYTFMLARAYAEKGMSAYVELQSAEFAAESLGFTAVKHQQEVGAGYYDQILQATHGDNASMLALEGSTEKDQFKK